MIPNSNHNEALSGDVLYSAFLNYEWRQIVLPFIIAGMAKIAAGIEDESERQDFEVLYGAMIDDFYNEDIVDGIQIGMIVPWAGSLASIPAKYLLCNGALRNISEYPELAAVLADEFIEGDDFRVPHLTGRFLRGATADTDIGLMSGALSVTLSEANLPAHHHVVPAHSHTFLKASTVAGVNTRAAIGSNNAIADQATSQQPATNTSDIGSGTSFQILPLNQNIYYIIKALP